MIYSRQQFASELLIELEYEYDAIRISRWAFSKVMDPDTHIEDSELDSIIIQLVAMEEGPEFEYTENELRDLAQQLMREKNE